MIRSTTISTGWTFTSAEWRSPPGYLACSKLEWLPAEVPGHVHVDLVRNGVIGDPFVGRQELGCQWVDQVEWIYAVEFAADPSAEFPVRKLRFEGLDTVCEVRFNGELIGVNDNMFVPLELDVTESLRRGVNRLEVRFLSATQVGAQRRDAYFERSGLQPDLVRFDERAFVRKAAYMYGWDWGPRLVSAGIWRPVTLVEFAARITDVHVEQHHRPDGDVSLRVVTEKEGEGAIVHFWRTQGESRWQRLDEGGLLHLTQPSLWWPAGSGGQSLHELVTLLVSPGEPSDGVEECEQRALDRKLTKVGLRDVVLRQEPDAWGTSFRFEVNGRPVWCVGANWIPEHSFPSQSNTERLRQQLQKARAMNMNMLRVWGGGVYESETFYDLCDELGILVWQDFPFACSYAPDDEPAIEAIEREAAFAIRRLRNRASLALWCGNNENLMMFEAKWDDANKHPARCHGERIWESALPGLLAYLDPTRTYVSTSPHSPTAGERANADGCGDQHNWDVWHGRGDWVHYRESKARFASEYGFAAAPSRAAWHEAFGEKVALRTREVRDPVAIWHDKTKKGYDTFVGFADLHYARSSNLEEWTYHSQLNQRDALCTAIEHYRSSEFCAGSLIWQLNDCWPVQSWSVLDNTGTLKAAGHELARLYAPALATVHIRSEGSRCFARFVVVSDNSPLVVIDSLSVQVRNSLDGAVLEHVEVPVRLEPGERRVVLDLDLTAVDSRQAVIWFTFAGTTAHRLICEPRQVTTAPVTWLAEQLSDDVLALHASASALDVWVLPEGAEALDNFLSLAVAGTLLVRVSGPCTGVRLRWLGGSANVLVTAGADPLE